MDSKKRVRDNSDELEINSPDVKRLREDLLDDLYDSEFSTTNHDLDLFMRSFEEEITSLPLPAVTGNSSESGESQPELGYLLEASDDELGLPPPTEEAGSTGVQSDSKTEFTRVSNESVVLGNELWGLDEQIPSYDSFDMGYNGNIGESEGFNGNIGEYVGFDGLFDHSDLGFGSDFLWRPETLPAQ